MDCRITRRKFCSEITATSIVAATAATVPVAIGNDYSLENYRNDILTIGLAKTWEKICEKVLSDGEDENGILRVSNFGELYEIGLALQD